MKYLIIYLLSISTFALELDVVKSLWNKEKADVITKSLSQHFYTGDKKTRNYYAHFHFPKGKIDNALFLITGLEDPVPSWFDTALLAKEKGFKDVYILEIRGQGESEREAKKNIIHVDDFKSYYKDLSTVFSLIDQKKKLDSPSYVIAHSTGALLLTNGLEEIVKKVPGFKIKAASFWTPLFVFRINPMLNNYITRPLIGIFNKLYRLCCGIYLARNYGPKDFEINTITTDFNNFKRSEALKFKYKLGTEGVSLHWVLESIKAAENVLNKVERFDYPTIVFKAQRDQIVSNEYKINNPYVATEIVLKAKHALNIEKNIILNHVWKRTMSFWKL